MINIQFCIEHHYFRDALYVWMKWELPYLPRIGETINSWFWIQGGAYDTEKIKELLTSEGEASLNDWGGEFKDWLYEMGCSADVITNLAYFRGREDGSPYVHLLLQEENR